MTESEAALRRSQAKENTSMNKIIEFNTQNFQPFHLALAAALLAAASLANGQTDLTTISPAQRIQLRAERPKRILVASQALDLERSRIGLTADDTFDPVASAFDDAGGLHVRYVRRYKKVRVIGGSVKVSVNPQGGQGSVRRLSPMNVAVASVVPTVSEVSVQQTIATDMGVFVGELDSQLELVILPPGKTRKDPRLAWMAVADAPEAEATRYYVDALTGAILLKGPAHVYNDDVTPGTGKSFYSGQVPITTRYSSAQNKFKLQDTTRGGTLIYDVEDKKPTSSFHGNPYWNNDNTWGNGIDWEAGDSTKGATGQTAAVDAFHRARLTWDMLSKVYGREGLRDDNDPMKLRVHVRKKKSELYGDAHWDGYFANFGDGKESDDPHRARLLTVPHELGHGLWTFSVSEDKDDWKDEARGLNEGHGDIMAMLVHHYAELAKGTGATVPTSAPGDLSLFRGRSVNPLSYEAGGQTGLRWYMPNMGDYEEHVQGCAYGKMFATLAMGAPSQAEYDAGAPCTANSGNSYSCLVSPWLPQGMAGIGMQKAGKIWYRATTANFPAKPTFSSTRADYLEAAAYLYGASSPEYKSVMNAFRAINVGPEATDTEHPTAGLSAPIVDNQEETVRLNVSGSDDIGVVKLDISLQGAAKTVAWSTFNGYLSLANTPYGTRAVNAKAYDALGKIGQTSRQMIYSGANFLIDNRGFESGSSGWTASSGTLIKNDSKKAFVGSRYVSFTVNSSVRQQFTAPAGANYCTVGYRVSVTSNILATMPLQVELMQANGTTVQSVLNTISPALDTTDSSSNNYKKHMHTINNCAGQTRWIRFRTIAASPDQYRLDNVFVTYYAAPTADFSVAVDEAEGSVIFALKNIQNIQPEQIDYVEIGSPGANGAKLRYAPYLIIRPASDFTPNATYQVKASIVTHAGIKVFNSPTLPFIVREVNQLVKNPGFEPSGTFWARTGSTAWCNPPGAGEGSLGFMGTGCAAFTGNGTVYQLVSIPSGPGQAQLTFRLKIKEGSSQHVLGIKVENPVTGHSTSLGGIVGNANTNAGTSHKEYRKFTYNLTPFMGQTIRLKFEAVDNSPNPMLFYVDNVGVTHKTFGVTTQ